MKKRFCLIAVASIIVAGISCRKETPVVEFSPLRPVVDQSASLTISTHTPVTMTAISGTAPTWKAGDRVSVVYTNTSDNVVTAKSSALGSDTEEATFSVTLISPDATVPAYAYYPANSESPTASEATLVIPGRQAPTGSSFDGAADILISKPFTPSGSVSTQFRRLGAVLKLKISNDLIAGDYLKKILVTADTPLAGKVEVDLDEAVATGISGGSNTVVAEYSALTQFRLNSADDYIYLIVYPQTLSAGTHLVIEGVTDNATFSRDITLPSDMVLMPGHIQPLSISVSTVNRTFFKETFGGADSALGTGSADLTCDNASWTFENEFAAGSGAHTARLGTSSAKGIATTPSISIPAAYRGQSLKLSFKAAAWDLDGEATTVAVSASGTGVTLSGAALSDGKVTTEKGSWTTYVLDIATTEETTSVSVTFQGQRASKARFFLDDVAVYLGTLDYTIVDLVPAYATTLPQYLNCNEIPAVVLVDPTTYTATGKETFGDTNWYEYDTEDATRKIVTHTYDTLSTVYRNFTAMVDQDMRCPLWTAYPMHAGAYPNKGVPRGSFSESSSYDPGIPRSWQSSGSTDDYDNGNGYARGHHCASEDRQSCRNANDQTFYYTNQSPQWQNSFNGGMWASLEGAVQSHAPTGRDTLYVVVGTLFDPLVTHASNDGGLVARPSHFYKLLMLCSFNAMGDMIGANGVAYLYTNEAHTTGTYNDATFRKSIDYIEGLTGFDFFANVPPGLQSTAESTNDSLW